MCPTCQQTLAQALEEDRLNAELEDLPQLSAVQWLASYGVLLKRVRQ